MSEWWNFYLECKTLIFTTLLADSADDKLVIAYFFFPENRIRNFSLCMKIQSFMSGKNQYVIC